MTSQHPYKTSMGAVFLCPKKILKNSEYCKGIARFGVLIYDHSKRKTQRKNQKRRNENAYTFFRLWRPGDHCYSLYNQNGLVRSETRNTK